jgi:hypothetical protein
VNILQKVCAKSHSTSEGAFRILGGVMVNLALDSDAPKSGAPAYLSIVRDDKRAYSGFHSSGDIISGFCPHICLALAIHLFTRTQNAVLPQTTDSQPGLAIAA